MTENIVSEFGDVVKLSRSFTRESRTFSVA
jgi:hypothetical protein